MLVAAALVIVIVFGLRLLSHVLHDLLSKVRPSAMIAKWYTQSATLRMVTRKPKHDCAHESNMLHVKI